MALLFRMPILVPTLALILAALPVLALADEKPAVPKGDWQVGMMKEKEQFAYCLMRAPYDNGLALAIALSPRGEINIGVQVPKASYDKDDKYPMKVGIDAGAKGGFKRERISVAVNPELLLTPMGPDKDVMNALRKGKVLSMQGPQDTAYFKLAGTTKALSKLQQCVDAGTGKAKAAPMDNSASMADAKPTGKAAKNGKGGKGEQANGAQGKFPPSLMQLLRASGLKNIEVMPIPDPEKAPVDFAWKTDGAFGGVRERPMPKDVTIEKMSGIIETGFKNQCKDTFSDKIGDIETAPGVKLRKADISCTGGAHSTHVSLLLYLTDTNLFTMFMHEAPQETKEAAMKARDMITDTIRQLAQKQGGSGGAPAADSKPASPAPDSAAPAASPPASAPSIPPSTPEKPAEKTSP